MRFLVIGGLLLLGGLGYAQAHSEARQRQALLDKNTTLEPAGGAAEPVQQSELPSTMRRLSPALEKASSAPTPQEATSPQPQHPSTERQLKPALEKAPSLPTPQEETSPQPQHPSTERQLKPALEKAPSLPTPQDETSPQPQHSSTERQLKPALEKVTKPE